MQESNSCSLCIVDPDQENTNRGYIVINGSKRPIVAQNSLQWVILAISRVTAFLMYPDLCILFLGKCRALMNFLSSSPLSHYMHPNIHEVHKSSGKFIFYLSVIHSLFHMLRWGIAGNIKLLITSYTGVTGIIGLGLMLIIIIFMMFNILKQCLNYELRKLLHYMCIPLAVTMCWHVPASALPWGGYMPLVLGVVLCVYVLDFLYVGFYMTE